MYKRRTSTFILLQQALKEGTKSSTEAGKDEFTDEYFSFVLYLHPCPSMDSSSSVRKVELSFRLQMRKKTGL